MAAAGRPGHRGLVLRRRTAPAPPARRGPGPAGPGRGHGLGSPQASMPIARSTRSTVVDYAIGFCVEYAVLARRRRHGVPGLWGTTRLYLGPGATAPAPSTSHPATCGTPEPGTTTDRRPDLAGRVRASPATPATRHPRRPPLAPGTFWGCGPQASDGASRSNVAGRANSSQSPR